MPIAINMVCGLQTYSNGRSEDMEKDELSMEELDNLNVSPNNIANYENAMNNKNLYRQKQIKELEALKEQIYNQGQEEPTKKSGR